MTYYITWKLADYDGKSVAIVQQRSNFSTWLARRVIAPLAELERLAAQLDAWATTLELYKRKYFI